jgi:hypothetical protein
MAILLMLTDRLTSFLITNMTKAAEASKRLSILVGAVTTDFTLLQ